MLQVVTFTSDSGAICGINLASIIIDNCFFNENTFALKLEQCGARIGYIGKCTFTNNLSAVMSIIDSENIIAYTNLARYNGGAVYCSGGIDNIFGDMSLEGNWNSAIYLESVANTRIRTSDMNNNNRAAFTALGEIGHGLATVHIAGTTIDARATFLCQFISSHVQNTGLGANVDRTGILLDADLDSIGDRDKSVISIDNVGFMNQDYAVDVQCDVSNVKMILGDCTYVDTSIQNVRIAEGFIL